MGRRECGLQSAGGGCEVAEWQGLGEMLLEKGAAGNETDARVMGGRVVMAVGRGM